jgi:hypothetical protein
MVGCPNKMVYISGASVMIVTIILSVLVSSASAQGKPPQDLAQANFTVIYTHSVGGFLPIISTIS